MICIRSNSYSTRTAAKNPTVEFEFVNSFDSIANHLISSLLNLIYNYHLGTYHLRDDDHDVIICNPHRLSHDPKQLPKIETSVVCVY